MECHGRRDTVIPTQWSCASPRDFSPFAEDENVAHLLFLPCRCSAQQPARCNTGGMKTPLLEEPARASSTLICFQDPNPALLLGILHLSLSLPLVSAFLQQLSAEVLLLPAPLGGSLPRAAPRYLHCPALPTHHWVPVNWLPCPTLPRLAPPCPALPCPPDHPCPSSPTTSPAAQQQFS